MNSPSKVSAMDSSTFASSPAGDQASVGHGSYSASADPNERARDRLIDVTLDALKRCPADERRFIWDHMQRLIAERPKAEQDRRNAEWLERARRR